MKRLSNSEKTLTVSIALLPSTILKLDAMVSSESRSSFIRHLIEQAWAEFSKKEQE